MFSWMILRSTRDGVYFDLWLQEQRQMGNDVKFVDGFYSWYEEQYITKISSLDNFKINTVDFDKRNVDNFIFRIVQAKFYSLVCDFQKYFYCRIWLTISHMILVSTVVQIFKNWLPYSPPLLSCTPTSTYPTPNLSLIHI